jgi:glycosyltransferase 2 family protein
MTKKILKILRTLWQSQLAQKLVIIGSIFFSVSILSYLIYTQWDALKSHLSDLRPSVLLFAFLIYTIILLSTSSVWADIINKLGHHVPFSKHFLAFCISALGKRLPGTFWYIAWRANLYQENDYSGRLLVLTSGIEMIAILIAAIIVSLFFSVSLIGQFRYTLIGYGIVILAILFFFHPEVNQWVFKKLNVDFSRFNFKNMALWTTSYIIIWPLIGILLFVFANIFTKIDSALIGYFIGSTALTGVLSRLFLFLPSHFGFGEVSLSLLLSGIMPSSLAVVVAVSNRILITLFEITWALIALGIRKLLRK